MVYDYLFDLQTESEYELDLSNPVFDNLDDDFRSTSCMELRIFCLE